MPVVSANMKKYRATASVNGLIAENYRTEEDARHFDDGHRNIDVSATAANVFLMDRPENYDRQRKEKIDRVNKLREKRATPEMNLKNMKRKLKTDGKLKAASNKQIASRRKLRRDTVDTLGIVIQTDADFINALDRNDQNQFFSDALDVIRENPDWFGVPETAVIHYDETTPHMQVLATSINEKTLVSDADRILGNKTKMSTRQDVIANGLKAKGWDIDRGMKRVDNPEYKNFKSEMEQQGLKVTRHNDAVLKEQYDAAKAEAAKIIQKAKNEAERLRNERVAELEKMTAETYQALQEAREATNTAWKSKKAYDEEYNAAWGPYKDEMRRLREENDKIWKDPAKKAEWDKAAAGLRDAKRMQQYTEGAGFIGVAFAIIGAVRERKYAEQLQTMKVERQKALYEVKQQREALKNEMAEGKTQLSALKDEVKRASEERNDLQRDYKALQQQLEEARQDLAPFQRQATEKLEEAIKTRSKTAKDWERVLDMVRAGELESDKVKEVSERYNPLTEDRVDKFSDEIQLLSRSKNSELGM